MTAAHNCPKTAMLSGYVTFPFVIVFGGGHDIYVADNAY